jgi:CheY-like chemotaxis protein
VLGTRIALHGPKWLWSPFAGIEADMQAVLEVKDTVPKESSTKPGILVMDREAAVRELLRFVLDKAGFRTWLAHNPSQAWRVYRQNAEGIHVVLADLGAFEMAGPCLFSRLRALPSSVPVCFMTDAPAPVGSDQWKQFGVAGLFPKPFDFLELVPALWQIALEELAGSGMGAGGVPDSLPDVPDPEPNPGNPTPAPMPDPVPRPAPRPGPVPAQPAPPPPTPPGPLSPGGPQAGWAPVHSGEWRVKSRRVRLLPSPLASRH